jgi:hypothetical protein
LNKLRSLVVLSLLSVSWLYARADSVQELSSSFWQWRAQEQPFSEDDIPRIERPAGFAVDWSSTTIERRLAQLEDFERRWKSLTPAASATVHEQVDYRLLGSAIARVRWELAIQKNWQRNPEFYVDQTLGSVYVLLLPPPPFSEERQSEIVGRIKRIPATIEDAKQNLMDMRQPFVQLAVDALDKVSERLGQVETALGTEFSEGNRKALVEALPAAAAALEEFRAWLETKLPQTLTGTAVGRENYIWFLRNVALLPYSPEQLLEMARLEWSRSVAFEAYQEERLAGLPPAPIFANADAQIAAEKAEEEKVRAFLTDQ